MTVLPPGTILQHMYLRERLRRQQPGRFIEIGPGYGDITAILLHAGWHGTLYEMSEASVAHLQKRFESEIAEQRLEVIYGDFLTSHLPPSNVDLLISSMVIEHLSDADEHAFMTHARQTMSSRGIMIGMMPAGMQYWGVEDEIAGHFRRYDRARIHKLCDGTDWRLDHIAGLTFPVSNILLPLSNRQVQHYEGHKVEQTMTDRTKDSGHREVPFKTEFPPLLGILLNPIVMQPFHWLQKLAKHSSRCLVLYFEATPHR